jgi:hypothetical protein
MAVLVAKELGRNYVGIELNGDYIRLAVERVGRCVRTPKEDDLFWGLLYSRKKMEEWLCIS